MTSSLFLILTMWKQLINSHRFHHVALFTAWSLRDKHVMWPELFLSSSLTFVFCFFCENGVTFLSNVSAGFIVLGVWFSRSVKCVAVIYCIHTGKNTRGINPVFIWSSTQLFNNNNRLAAVSALTAGCRCYTYFAEDLGDVIGKFCCWNSSITVKVIICNNFNRSFNIALIHLLS